MLLFLYTIGSLLVIYIVSKRKIKISLNLTVLLAFILRVVVLIIFLNSKSEDIGTFVRDGQYILDKSSKYEASYFPFISYLGALAILLKSYIHPYVFLKIIFALFDSLILLPLYFLAKKNLQAVLIYALNPVSIIVTCIHGQMDSITMLFFLTGIFLFKKNEILISVLTISFSIFTKPWPLLFVIPLIRQAKTKLLFILLLFFPIVLTYLHSLIFPTRFSDIIMQVKNYRGIFGVWGISQVIVYFYQSSINSFLEIWWRRIFFAGFAAFQTLTKKTDILRSILLAMLLLYVFSPTFGIQWLVWSVPFVILVKPKYWRSYLVVISLFTLIGFAWDAYPYFKNLPHWSFLITSVGFLTWLFIMYLFFVIMKLPPQKIARD